MNMLKKICCQWCILVLYYKLNCLIVINNHLL